LDNQKKTERISKDREERTGHESEGQDEGYDRSLWENRLGLLRDLLCSLQWQQIVLQVLSHAALHVHDARDVKRSAENKEMLKGRKYIYFNFEEIPFHFDQFGSFLIVLVSHERVFSSKFDCTVSHSHKVALPLFLAVLAYEHMQ